MTRASDPQPPIGCPMHHARALPSDGTPLAPSPEFAAWRESGPATPLRYWDGHEGWLVTQPELGKAVLGDPRFSLNPTRLPAGFRDPVDPRDPLSEGLDAGAEEAFRAGNLLRIDPPQHGPLRRAVTKRFSVRAVREQRDKIVEIVDEEIARLRAQESAADVAAYGRAVSTRVHCKVLGVPDDRAPDFRRLFTEYSTTQQKFEFVRDVLRVARENPGENVMSDLLASELSDTEIEGLTFMLMVAGHDSVAYMIATATVALLTHPEQLEELRKDPELMPSAVEEFMRYGAMFVALFPRTATEDVELPGLVIEKGTSVSVSPVAANRDAELFDAPDELQLDRDAFGHLGFGAGPHVCLGQQLARVEVSEALTRIIELPGLRLAHAEQLEPMPFAHPVAAYAAGSVMVEWS